MKTIPPGVAKALAAASAAIMVSACAETELFIHSAKELSGSPDGGAVTKTKGFYKIGTPYRIAETWYYPAEDFRYSETGIASWYGPKFHAKRTANGETFDMNTLTAAHRTLPMPSAVRVINLSNGRSLILRINDRGPFARGRIIDVSRRAAQLLGFQRQGTARVRVEIMADESQRMKLAALNGKKLPEVERVAGRAVPKQAVQTQTLTPDARAPRPAAPSRRVAAAPRQPVTRPGSQVRTEPVSGKGEIFVQAGAYIGFANASKVRTQMTRFGPAWLSEARVGRQKFYRVRIGPLQTVPRADRVLSRVIAAGFPSARIVVD